MHKATRMPETLSDVLLAEGRLSAQDLARARLVADGKEPTAGLLLRLGFISERDLAQTLGSGLDLPLVLPEDYPESPLFGDLLKPAFLKENHLLPIACGEEGVMVAMADPTDELAKASLRLFLGKEIRPAVAVASEIEDALERLYGAGKNPIEKIAASLGEDDAQEDIARLRDMASEAPVIRLVNLILTRALDAHASDIHIEPFEGKLGVRFRVDGMLQEVESPPSHLAQAIISRVKIMANLNIAERRLPQDGRIQMRVQGRDIDLRVSSVPTLHGESLVLRILDKESLTLDFDVLGFSSAIKEKIISALGRPHGVILVTGPTGSGKTTTLYTALSLLNTPEKKILTVEDPVEYQIPGVNQVQVKPQIGLTFANALRSLLRQDPDVLMIGEIRDRETAEIATQAALTGHLVLSTLHTNDAASSITRLLDMGVEDYLLASTLTAVVAQRLVRTLCPACGTTDLASAEVIAEFSLPAGAFLGKAQGCRLCGGSGYQGRTVVAEVLWMDENIRRLALTHAQSQVIADEARKEGMRTMQEDGVDKALGGRTTLEEVLRVTREA